MTDKLKKHNVPTMAHMNVEELGFAIETLHASQKLRHMRIALNQPIHFQTSFEQA